MIHPAYLDGPLEGKDFPVQDNTRYVNAVVPRDIDCQWIERDFNPFEPSMEIVTYQLYQFAFRSGDTYVWLWTAWCREKPTARKIAEHLLSDYAKKAIGGFE